MLMTPTWPLTFKKEKSEPTIPFGVKFSCQATKVSLLPTYYRYHRGLTLTDLLFPFHSLATKLIV